jgi:putative salt-induced outer membrane protein
MRFAPSIFSALLGCAATAAQAELPEGARAMIDAAIASGDERKVATVIGLARSTWPEERSTIDAINDQWKITLAARRAAEAEAEQTALINAGMFDRWSGEGELGAFQSSGNTESVGVAAALRLDREGIDWTHSIRLRADYQRQNGSTSREQFAASYEPRWQFDENIFAYGLAQYERDRIQGFSSRYSVSGGFGYRVIDNPKLKLSLKAGPAYRVTDFTDGTSADRLAGLVGLDFDWQMLDRLKLTQDVEALAETGGEATLIFDGANTTINLVTGLDFRVSNRLRSRLSYKVEYDSNPPAGSEGTDTLTRATLIYGF